MTLSSFLFWAVIILAFWWFIRVFWLQLFIIKVLLQFLVITLVVAVFWASMVLGMKSLADGFWYVWILTILFLGGSFVVQALVRLDILSMFRDWWRSYWK